jgi:hypothetical protein
MPILTETHPYSCPKCGTSFNPGERCDCPDGTCVICQGDLWDADCVLTRDGPAHESCGLERYDERDSTTSLGLEGR